MSIRLPRVILISVILAAFSFPAFAAENATIAGDGVNVRGQPAVWKTTLATLDRGTRVEAQYVSDFTDTVDGVTAPWYLIQCNSEPLGYGNSGFVFGGDVALDPGTVVPPLTIHHSSYADPIERFIQHGLHAFGENETAIVRTLGRPVSIRNYDAKKECDYLAFVYGRKLTYPGIVIDIRRETKTGPEDIHRLSITTGAYSFDGLKVGSAAADVERALGTPFEETGESLTYRDGVMVVHTAVFTLRDGVVTGILLETTYSD